MNSKLKIIIVSIVSLLILVLINDTLKSKIGTEPQKKDPKYYLTSPWVTARVGWFFLTLPENWSENLKEFEKKKADYSQISKEYHMYELKLKDFYLVCIYIDAKEGIYEGWDLDKSSSAMANQALYNLNCKDITLTKLDPFDNPKQVNYMAKSNCSPYNYIAKFKAIRFESHIIIVSTFFKEADPILETISERILNGLINKYPEVTNANK